MMNIKHLLRRARDLLTGGGRAAPAPVGRLDLGGLRRTSPVSRNWGYDRGLPVDRHYIEDFLERHQADVRGRVLEVGDDSYTRRFGGDRVTARDVLHVDPRAPQATIVADLTDAGHVPSDLFDCVILTQTLHLIYDFRAAIETVHRVLRPGGVLLATVPGITPTSHSEWAGQWYWSFTCHSARRVFEERFAPRDVVVECYGNVLTAAAFLYGLAAEELKQEELSAHDPDYQVTVAVRAVKSERPG